MGAEVEIYDNGMVNIETKYQKVTMHITQCTIVWWEKQEEDKPKLVKISVKKPSSDDEVH